MPETTLPEPTVGKFDLAKGTTQAPLTPYTPTPTPLAGEQLKQATQAEKFAWAPNQATQALNIGKERRTADAVRTYKVQQNQQVEATKAEITRIEGLIAAENAKISGLQGRITTLDGQINSLTSQIQAVRNTVIPAPQAPPPPPQQQPTTTQTMVAEQQAFRLQPGQLEQQVTPQITARLADLRNQIMQYTGWIDNLKQSAARWASPEKWQRSGEYNMMQGYITTLNQLKNQLETETASLRASGYNV